jgi:hypothetical protein
MPLRPDAGRKSLPAFSFCRAVDFSQRIGGCSSRAVPFLTKGPGRCHPIRAGDPRGQLKRRILAQDALAAPADTHRLVPGGARSEQGRAEPASRGFTLVRAALCQIRRIGLGSRNTPAVSNGLPRWRGHPPSFARPKASRPAGSLPPNNGRAGATAGPPVQSYVLSASYEMLGPSELSESWFPVTSAPLMFG